MTRLPPNKRLQLTGRGLSSLRPAVATVRRSALLRAAARS